MTDLPDLGALAAGGAWEYGTPPAEKIAELGDHKLAHRKVADGQVMALVFERAAGWHLVLIFQPNGHRTARELTWAEIANARDHLLPPDVGVVATVPLHAHLAGQVFLFEYPPRPIQHPAGPAPIQPYRGAL